MKVSMKAIGGFGVRRTRAEIACAYSMRCVYCNKILTGIQLDHVRPRSRGGKDDLVNVVAACADCNMAKGKRVPAEFIARAGLDLEAVASRMGHAIARLADPQWKPETAMLELARQVLASRNNGAPCFVAYDRYWFSDDTDERWRARIGGLVEEHRASCERCRFDRVVVERVLAMEGRLFDLAPAAGPTRHRARELHLPPSWTRAIVGLESRSGTS